jgi:hypothetical protein
MAGLSKQTRIWIIVIALAALLGLGLLWFFSSHERVTRMQPLPLTGEAAYNPFFALKRTLERTGLKVQSESELRFDKLALKPGETLLIGGRPENLSESQLEDIEGWVASGGHAMIALQQTRDRSFSELIQEFLREVEEANRQADRASDSAQSEDAVSSNSESENDADEREQEQEEEQERGSKRLRDAQDAELVHRYQLSLEPSEGCPLLSRADTHAALPDIRFCPEVRFYLPPPEEQNIDFDFDWLLGNDDVGYSLARAKLGRGSVLFISDMQWLATYRLRDDSSLYPLARQIFDAPVQRKQRVVLVYGSRMPSLMVMLVERGWPILVPLLLALFLWAYKRSARFGPLLAHQLAPRRALKEHVLAAGEFLFRRGRGLALHEALMRHVWQKIRRKHPQLESLNMSERIVEIAKLYKLDPSAVQQALLPEDLDKPHVFVQSIRTLLLLRK